MDLRIGIALALSLSTMAVISFVVIETISRKKKMPALESVHLTDFKGKRFDLRLSRAGITSFLKIRILSVSIADYRDTKLESLDGGEFNLSFIPLSAGRILGLRMKFELADPLGLFAIPNEIFYPYFILDVLPRSLLSKTQVRVPILAIGELPAGTVGQGQELHSIENYLPTMETKSIDWKRAAKSSEMSLFVRLRESNIPRVVKISLIRFVSRNPQESVAWIDQFCEASCAVGKIFLDLGSKLIIRSDSDASRLKEVSSLPELSNVVMEFSASPPQMVPSIGHQTDLIVTGTREIENEAFRHAVRSIPCLLISDGGAKLPAVGSHFVVFSGKQSDLVPLVNTILER